MSDLSYISIRAKDTGSVINMRECFEIDRCEVFAGYIIDTGATVRACAAHFGISKSTVHKDVTSKLRYINPPLYKQVKEILDINKSERHIRGGEATRKKYLGKHRKNMYRE